jgi:hypothetical protein
LFIAQAKNSKTTYYKENKEIILRKNLIFTAFIKRLTTINIKIDLFTTYHLKGAVMKNCIFLIIITCLFLGCQNKQSQQSAKSENESIQIAEEQKTESEKEIKQEETEKTSKQDDGDTKKNTEINEEETEKYTNSEEEEKWLSTERLWKMYNESRAKTKAAEKKDDFEEMSKYSHESAVYANALERNDIEAWQYNNAAYYLIKAFKQKTNYQDEMNTLNNLELKVDILEFREEMKQKFRQEQRLLSKADGYLVKAKEVDDKLEVSDRTKMIANNMLFVSDVLGLLDVGDKK